VTPRDCTSTAKLFISHLSHTIYRLYYIDYKYYVVNCKLVPYIAWTTCSHPSPISFLKTCDFFKTTTMAIQSRKIWMMNQIIQPTTSQTINNFEESESIELIFNLYCNRPSYSWQYVRTLLLVSKELPISSLVCPLRAVKDGKQVKDSKSII
jgi:predicted membrane metal-binding protein